MPDDQLRGHSKSWVWCPSVRFKVPTVQLGCEDQIGSAYDLNMSLFNHWFIHKIFDEYLQSAKHHSLLLGIQREIRHNLVHSWGMDKQIYYEPQHDVTSAGTQGWAGKRNVNSDGARNGIIRLSTQANTCLSCMTFSKLLNLFLLQYLICKMEIKPILSLKVCCED